MTTPSPDPARDLAQIVLSVAGIGLLIAGTLWVLEPFLGSVLWATTITVATWPIMLRVQAGLGGRRGAAVAVMTMLLLFVVFVPLYLALSAILQQADRLAELAGAIPSFRLPPPPAWVEALPLVGASAAERWSALSALEPHQLAERVAPHLSAALSWFAAHAGTFGGMLIHFLLTVVVSAVLYARGETAASNVRRFFRRLAGERGDAIVTLSAQAIRAVALGIVVTALVQTAVAGLGLFVVGVPLAGFLTAVVLVLCIAQIGPLLPLAPAVVWLYASGSPGRATVLLVFTVVAGTLDNVLRPVLIRRGADLSLVLILPGVIGGLLWLGIIGLFIGPVVLAVTATLLDRWITSGLGEAEPGPEPEAPPVLASGAGAA